MILRKSKTPQKIARKVDFSEPRLYNAPSLDTVNFWNSFSEHPILHGLEPLWGHCRRADFYQVPGFKRMWFSNELQVSGTKKEPKPKLLSPDIFQWGRGLPHEGVGAKKFGMPLETREIKLFWWDIPGFCWDMGARKVENKKVWVRFSFRKVERPSSQFGDSRGGKPWKANHEKDHQNNQMFFHRLRPL